MTTIVDTFRDPSGAPVASVVVRATLIAASELLAGGGAIIRDTETVTADDGTWSLTLVSVADLAIAENARYLITAEGHRWAIDVPTSGTYALVDVLIEPAPLPPNGATVAALNAHATHANIIRLGITDPVPAGTPTGTVIVRADI